MSEAWKILDMEYRDLQEFMAKLKMAWMQNSVKSIKVGIEIWVNPDILVQTFKSFLNFLKLKTITVQLIQFVCKWALTKYEMYPTIFLVCL